MIPVIEELEGSVERHDMSAQMSLLAHEVDELSQSGMPGDSAEATLVPVDGDLKWDTLRGGMWYSATWYEGHSFRVDNALNFDDSFDIRHQESRVNSVCLTDMRSGPANPYIYTTPAWAETAIITAKPGLAIPLGPIEVDYLDNGVERTVELQANQVANLDLTNISQISSSHQLNLFYSAGDGGLTLVEANDRSPVNRLGQSFSIPLTSNATVHVISEVANQITFSGVVDETTTHALPSGQNRMAVAHSQQVTIEDAGTLHVITSAPSSVIVMTGEGKTMIRSVDGAYFGSEFITPELDGFMEFTNPGNDAVTITWRGGGTSVAPNAVMQVPWPPAGLNGATMLDADGDISAAFIQTSGDFASSTGAYYLASNETARLSGNQFAIHTDASSEDQSLEISLAGQTTNYNLSGYTNASALLNMDNYADQITMNSGQHSLITITDHPIRATLLSGENGLIQALHDGEERCIAVGVQASGWINIVFPWENLAGRGEVDLANAKRIGEHPSSVVIEIIGEVDASNYATIGTSWSFHLSRLAYQFSSSVTGMEVAYSGGAVLTNHPEFNPYVIQAPSDRGGPGPRFAATVPALHPTSNSVTGAGNMLFDVELVTRDSLASTTAYEVRRGWAEPYGTAIAEASADGLDSSEDWTVYPGRLDLLSDYVGWVPDPSFGTSESVWHTSGEAIQFTLQISTLNVEVKEVIS